MSELFPDIIISLLQNQPNAGCSLERVGWEAKVAQRTPVLGPNGMAREHL